MKLHSAKYNPLSRKLLRAADRGNHVHAAAYREAGSLYVTSQHRQERIWERHHYAVTVLVIEGGMPPHGIKQWFDLCGPAVFTTGLGKRPPPES